MEKDKNCLRKKLLISYERFRLPRGVSLARCCTLEVAKRMIMQAREILSLLVLRFIKFLYDFIGSPLGCNIEHNQKDNDDGHDEGIITLIAIADCHVS